MHIQVSMPEFISPAQGILADIEMVTGRKCRQAR